MPSPPEYDPFPLDWVNETAVVIGAGPSLTAAQVQAVRGQRVVVINRSAEWAPWADVWWFCDQKFWLWHKDKIKAFDGEVWTLENLALRDQLPWLNCVRNAGLAGMADDGVTTGRNSGYQCIQLAAHRGARRILLLGFDMKADADGHCHWHENHKVPTRSTVYANKMLPHFPKLAADLAECGIEVINCTPGSALKVWPMMDIECALA